MSAYTLIKKEHIEEINSEGYLLKHKQSGAKIALLSNDDPNKVFSIAFRTPVSNSTGKAHIMEHCVLCGSEKFPLKDPFIELVKGSLNTFLNAMTYPDKTMFPVASCNDKDFQNLMHVYMDAVFYPNIYKYKEIFMQEGWHYHLEKESDDITINGVVYNEMKGAFSSPDDVLERQIMSALFPDTSYSFESGGDPDVIPSLTYQEFLDFHKTYYHPCNSYIYLYGDMDMEEKLKWLDEEYLSRFQMEHVESELKVQPAFEKRKETRIEFAVTEEEEERENTYLSYNTVINGFDDPKRCFAMQVIEYALFDMPGAPVKKALLDRGIGKDIYSSFDNGVRQPYFSVVAKNADESQKDEFVAVVRGELERAVKEGINKKSLLAGINDLEFKTREADYDYPKGLIYGIEMFDTWLFDENQPFTMLKFNQVFQFLKDNVETGYFEDLIQKYLLDNTHGALVIAAPKKGLNIEKEQQLSEKLKKYKASLSSKEIQQLITDTKNLAAYQEKEEAKEDLEKIPILDLEDISTKPEPFHITEKEYEGVKVLHHNFFTNQIGYLILGFDTNNLPEDLILYLGLYKSVFAMMDTDKYSYQDLANECTLHMGGIHLATNIYGDYEEKKNFRFMTEIRAKVMYDKVSYPFELAQEILFHTHLDDRKRLKEIISQVRSRLLEVLTSRGNATAVLRAMSYYAKPAYINDRIKGIEFYQFLADLEDNYEERYEGIVSNLQRLIRTIFRPENLIISYSANEEGFEQMVPYIRAFKESLCRESIEQSPLLEEVIRPVKKNEGFKSSSKVQYVASAGNFLDEGYEYTGTLKVFRMIMSYDYLWMNLRVKGGAYGCGCNCTRSGDCYFASFRDPNLSSSLESYRKVPDYLREFHADDRDMKKYIIGTISEMDTPLTNSARGDRSYSAYMSKIPYEVLQKERLEVLHTTQEDIRNLGDLVECTLKDQNVCVIGNAEKIEEEKDVFMEIKSLI